MTPAVAAASNISSPRPAALDPMLPLTPPRLESFRVDRDGPLVPRKPSLAQLKHGQHITSWSGWRACREHQRWSAGTYLLVPSRGRALSVALPPGSPWRPVLSSSFSSSSFRLLSSPLREYRRGHGVLETTVERVFASASERRGQLFVPARRSRPDPSSLGVPRVALGVRFRRL